MAMSPEALARASSRHPWWTIGIWLLLIATMGLVSSRYLGDVLTQDVRFTNRPESVRAQEILDRAFPGAEQGVETAFFIVGSPTMTTAARPFADRVRAVQSEIQGLGRDAVAGPPVSYLDVLMQAKWFFLPDYHGVLIALQLKGDVHGALGRIQEAVAPAAPEGYRAGVLLPDGLPLTAGALDRRAPQPWQAGEGPEGFVLVRSDTASILDPAFAEAVGAAQRAAIVAGGEAIVAPPTSGFDVRAQAAGLVSQDGRYTLIPVTLADSSDAIVEEVRGAADRVSDGGFTVQVAGGPLLGADFTTVADEDMRRSESLGLAVALIVLILVFAAVVAAVVPIVMGLFAIATALGLVALIGQFVSFNLFVESMVSMIGLAVGIDYSLFIVSRYREERRKGYDKLDAIGRSGATANRAVLFSGLTVVLALLGMFIIPMSIFRSLAGGAVVVTLVAIAASMTLLPAVLGLFGDRINWPRLSRRARIEGVAHDPGGGIWDRLTRGVMARPAAFLIASVLVLGGLGYFYFDLHRGTSTNISQLPDEFPSKDAFLTLEREFAGGTTDPVKVVVTGDVQSTTVQAAVEELRGAIGGSPAFAEITTMMPAADGETVVVDAYLRGDPSADSAFQAVRDLRSDLVPAAFDGVDGAEVLVGGNTAFFTDFLSIADNYQWIVLPFVLALSFVLLTVVFRSIVVPIKAIIMNLLSVGAAYGAVTLVFQKGAGLSFFNDVLGFRFERAEAIEAWLPLFLFSVLFGLSMDYHVFLLTRIREEYDRTGDNTEAVAYGLRTTAGIITGAAAIMVAVFASFAAGRLGAMQQMGFGLAVAVFLDATIVRTLLVPASMRLLGDVNWYLPRWLEWLPKLEVEGHVVPEAGAVPLAAEEAEVVRVPDHAPARTEE